MMPSTLRHDQLEIVINIINTVKIVINLTGMRGSRSQQ